MASVFYESYLQEQSDCLIPETYESKSFFFITCHFDQRSF